MSQSKSKSTAKHINNGNNDCNENENEELKTDSNGMIHPNGHNNKNNGDRDNNMNDKEINNKANKPNTDRDDFHLNIDPNDILEVGMLRHHEIENFSMDEDELEATCHPVSWSNCDATTFNVRRGPNYVSGQKSPSKKALYTVFALDAYKLPNKINKIWKYMNVDKYIKKYHVPYDVNKYPLPPLFILNCMVPNYPPELMGGKADGEGYQLIIYAHLSIETQQELTKYSKDPKQNKLTPSVELLRQFIHSDLVNSEIRNRFKCIARVMNSNHTDFGFLANRLVKRYNGKPFLARTSSTFYHEAGKYFAADIDAHLFGYPARQGLSYVKGTIQTAIYDVGFVIEGHTNDQLPEQILACCRLSKMGIDLCKPFPQKLMMSYLKHKQLRQQSQSQHIIQQDPSQQNKQQQQQQQSQKKIYPKSQSNLLLLNGNKNNDKNNKSNNNNNNNNDNDNKKGHRNGNVASKSAASLPASANTESKEKTSWGWGYFG